MDFENNRGQQTTPLLLLLLAASSTMMLVQKQPLFAMALTQSPSAIHHHRRHPSAPVVHVQPTRTPGLLTLSKPPRANNKSSPRPRAAIPAHTPAPRRSQAEPAALSTSATTPALTAAAPTTTATPRGRAQPNSVHTSTHPNNKRRSASHTASTRRRQPSPDPFAAPPQSSCEAAPPPPNKRRHPTKPIPVPPPVPNVNNNLSRSDPVLSHMPRRRQPPQRTTTLDSASFAHARSTSVSLDLGDTDFPICDDTTDVDPGSRPSTPVRSSAFTSSSPVPASPTTPRRPKPTLHLSEPRTPTRKTRQSASAPAFSFADPPRTAPLSSVNPGSFPFPPSNGTSPSPHTSPKRRESRRTKHLSEGVVLPPLFPFVFPKGEEGFAHAEIEEQSGRRSRSSERDPLGVAGNTLFASSMFQNSPSPEDLPPPLF
ncbi:hypothetical protein R3P38DRAFT_168450 [Favolaschia claudopus]|uniref:Uncharacterized protein n=1 Tax=Favolaschia claudopus TaxID=2862362 RepID=A0AAW0D0L4_9AGAR